MTNRPQTSLQPAILITCEHGGNEVPREYQRLFRGARGVLQSHRGWDPGALELAERFAARLGAPLFSSTVSRLVVELNRSPHHRSLFSEYTRHLPAEEQQRILATYYQPHRAAVERQLKQWTAARRRVLHLSVHSFTPVLKGQVRQAEIGLLYDPARAWERSFCDAWQRQLRQAAPELRVRKNYPYLGTADGFTTWLRKRFANAWYAGIELEVNQRLVQPGRTTWQRIQEEIIDAFAAVIR